PQVAQAAAPGAGRPSAGVGRIQGPWALPTGRDRLPWRRGRRRSPARWGGAGAEPPLGRSTCSIALEMRRFPLGWGVKISPARNRIMGRGPAALPSEDTISAAAPVEEAPQTGSGAPARSARTLELALGVQIRLFRRQHD